MSDISKPSANGWRILWLILAGSIAIKLALILYLGPRFHGDVVRAVNFGYGLHEGSLSIRTHFDNTKTWVGPSLWYHLFDLAGPWGLRLFNMLAFVALFGVQYLSGRRLYDRATLILALFLFAFYVGTHRNVMAGEPDDMMAALFFSTGLLVYLHRDRVVGTSLIMGLGLLFKFWVGIFFGGFVLFLLTERRWKALAPAVIAFLVPYACVNLIDGYASLAALLWSFGMQSGYDDWSHIIWRLLSTGLLPAVLASAWTVAKDPSWQNRLFFFVPIPYFAYVLLMRDAHATSAVMMLGMMYFGFLIAEFLLRSPYLGNGVVRRRLVAGVLAAYVVIMGGLAYYGSQEGTHPLQLREGSAGIEIPGRP
ncbi:MAG: glycosyltransferase family 39 protein [Gemmatimonadales bacterium]|jgi:hypothetical protein